MKLLFSFILLTASLAAQVKIVDTSMIKQNGATNNQPLCWSDSNNRWEPGNCGGASISDTDELSEGVSNLYFTNARSRSAISAGTNLSYDSVTGVMSLPSLPFTAMTGTVTDAQVPDTITITLAATASALAANGGNCAAGLAPLGVDASGAVESCFDVILPTEIDSEAKIEAIAGTTFEKDDISDDIIETLSNVDVTGLSDGNCLVYDGVTDNRWEPGSCGSAAGDPVGANGQTTFTSQTSVVISNPFGHAKVVTSCYDGSEIEIIPNSTTVGAGPNYDVTVTFGATTSGRCVIAGGGAAIFEHTVTASTSESVTAATHGLGTKAYVALCLDNSSPANQIIPDTATRNVSGDLVITFGSAFTGVCEIRQ